MRWALPLLLVCLGLPGVARAQAIEEAAVRYLKPAGVGLGVVELASSAVGLGFHLTTAESLPDGGPTLSRDLHRVAGALAVGRMVSAGAGIVAVADADSLSSFFFALGPPQIVTGALDLAGVAVSIAGAESVSGDDADATLSRIVHQGWAVTSAVFAGLEFAVAIATTIQRSRLGPSSSFLLVPAPGGIALTVRFGGPTAGVLPCAP